MKHIFDIVETDIEYDTVTMGKVAQRNDDEKEHKRIVGEILNWCESKEYDYEPINIGVDSEYISGKIEGIKQVRLYIKQKYLK